MDFFDLHTAYLIMGALYLAMPAAVWLALRHNLTPAVNAWCGGGMLFGLGLGLLSQRAQWPHWLTYELAVLFINLGQLVRVQALRLELQRPLTRTTLIGLPVAFLLLYEFGLQARPPDPVAALINLASLSACLAWIAHLSLRIAREQGLLSAYWLGGVYLPLSLMVFAHATQVGLGLSEAGPLQNHWGTVGMALLGNLTAVIGNTSFLGMHVERANQRQLATAREQARTAQSASLGQEIARLERMRSMGMVTSHVVHELSQPLTSIQLIAEHAELDGQQRPHDSAALREHIRNILQQSRQAAQALQRVRHFVAPREIEHRHLDLHQVHAQALAMLRDWLRSERVVLTPPAAQGPVHVTGDEVHLAQVLVNLYRNAVQATEGQSERCIRVRIGAHGDRAHVLVHDNGPGLSPEALEHAQHGRSFFSAPTDAKGLGMGLLISRKIVAQHRGQLRLRNHPEGGAVAELDLPLA